MSRTVDQICRTEHGPRPIPEYGELPVLTRPPARETELSNGLRVQLVHMPTVPLVHLQLLIPCADSDPRHAARAALLGRTLLAGSATRDRARIDSDLALVGASLDAVGTNVGIAVAGVTSRDGLDVVLDILTDALTGATYPEHEIENERLQLIQVLTMNDSRQNIVAARECLRRRFGEHPIAHTVPDPDLVQDLTVQEVRDIRTMLVPRGAILTLVGDLDFDDTVRLLEKTTSGWTSEASVRWLPPTPDVQPGDLLVVDKPGADQASIRMSAQAVRQTDPRHAAVRLANLVFGGYFSSRLMASTREDKGLSYAPRSELEITADNGSMVIVLDTATDTAAQAIEEIRAELRRFVEDPPGSDELDRARRFVLGQTMMVYASQTDLANQLTLLAGKKVDLDWAVSYYAELATVTVEQVTRIVREFFAPENFTGVIVGDASALATVLSDVDGVALPSGSTGA